ncbi:Na(+)/H(+) exchange regulatory cofactor NHE-RF1a isoform X2 [Sphaeramia orbicularis]|uniref:Na(+)/H(+) exchange regulatory cofactor NHE-RF n=1 Tax=Sphaeramia orbicularis TaxID=375764 RepID=A0A673AM90_9TELE|nr:Na(+)/H(+) exchange regulatory cofactor NHE-RF1-like isoform X2 [Sphaeramia orbicularis]
MSNLRPRLCVLEKGANGYGFHLHGEKGKTGQFIRLVEPDTPAAVAGLLAGDRLVFVNGDSVEGESHQQVVARIRATGDRALELIVVDAETAELLNKHNLQCKKEFVTDGIPLPAGDTDSDRGEAHSNGSPRESTPVPRENGDASSERSRRSSVSSKDEHAGFRPRLCHLKKGPSGYGFNLHSEKSKPGQFIRAVDDDSPAQRSGLRPKDKIIQVNGVSVLGMQHSEVVAAIKAGGDETKLLVVDAEAEEFFKRCNVQPTEEHVSGRLPEPVSEGASQEMEAAEEMAPKPSVSSSASDASSNAEVIVAAPISPPQDDQAPESTSADDRLGLGMSVAQARERAHQKRAAKKAPPMAWSKRNELFSNL